MQYDRDQFHFWFKCTFNCLYDLIFIHKLAEMVYFIGNTAQIADVFCHSNCIFAPVQFE